MEWKDRLKDPQYLMEMRRPAFIGARTVSIFSQRLRNKAVVWMFRDVVSQAIELMKVRPQIPNITLPGNIGDTISSSISNPVSKNVPTTPMGFIQKATSKKNTRKVRRWLGL